MAEPRRCVIHLLISSCSSLSFCGSLGRERHRFLGLKLCRKDTSFLLARHLKLLSQNMEPITGKHGSCFQWRQITPLPLMGWVSVSPLLLLLSRFSRVRFCATPWTAAHQAPPSMGFSRREYWSTGVGCHGLLRSVSLERPIAGGSPTS